MANKKIIFTNKEEALDSISKRASKDNKSYLFFDPNNITDFKEWVRLDLEYIDNWSFWGDIKILIKTIPVVFRGLGAK